MITLKCSKLGSLTFAALLACVPALSAGDLAGVISDAATDQPVPAVVVKVLETGDSTATDVDGKYFFAGMPDGSYTLLLGKSEYVPQIRSVHLGGYLCGDPSGDLTVNVGDAVFLINYIFKGGAAPNPLQAGDVNADATINVGDAVYLVNYIFRGGPAPQCL